MGGMTLVSGLKDAATSPLAFIAYLVLVTAWVVRTWLIVRPQRQAERIVAQYSWKDELALDERVGDLALIEIQMHY